MPAPTFPLLSPDDDEGAEAEAPAPFDDRRAAVDLAHHVLEFLDVRIRSVPVQRNLLRFRIHPA